MKAIVTGGAGFIGSHLIDKLLNEYKDIKILIKSLEINNISQHQTHAE